MFQEVHILFHFNIILNTTGCPLIKLTPPPHLVYMFWRGTFEEASLLKTFRRTCRRSIGHLSFLSETYPMCFAVFKNICHLKV